MDGFLDLEGRACRQTIGYVEEISESSAPALLLGAGFEPEGRPIHLVAQSEKE